MSSTNETQSVTVVRLTNQLAQAITVVVEPWGDEHTVAPGATASVSNQGSSKGLLEIEIEPDRIIVYGWEGSILELSVDAEEA